MLQKFRQGPEQYLLKSDTTDSPSGQLFYSWTSCSHDYVLEHICNQLHGLH